MPDENRFAGLGDATADPDPEADDPDAADEDVDDSDHAADPGGDTDDTMRSDTSDDRQDGGVDPEETTPAETPAFPFDATERRTVYVRPETLADLDDAQAIVDAQLRTDHEVRNLTGREFYDAVLQVGTEHVDEVIEAIVDAREEK